MAELQKAVQLSPGSIPAREELADLFGSLNRHAEEIEQLDVLAALDSRLERRVAVGLAHAKAGHLDLAVLTLGSAIERAPDQPVLYGALGRVWLDIAETRHDRPDAIGKALEALARAASSPTATSDVKTLYGRALARRPSTRRRRAGPSAGDRTLPGRPDGFLGVRQRSPNN